MTFTVDMTWVPTNLIDLAIVAALHKELPQQITSEMQALAATALLPLSPRQSQDEEVIDAMSKVAAALSFCQEWKAGVEKAAVVNRVDKINVVCQNVQLGASSRLNTPHLTITLRHS